MSLHKDNVLPITWRGWDEVEILSVNFYTVTFLDNFGVFAKDETCGTVTVCYQTGTLTKYDDYGNVVKEQKFKSCVGSSL